MNYLLFSLATYRATKLVIDDEVTRELRDLALDRLQDIQTPLARKLEYLLGCPWCVSIWAAGGLVVFIKMFPGAGELLRDVLAASAVTGILYERIG